MSNPFLNIWFSALATTVAAGVCYANFDQLADHWVAVFYLAVLTLNTILLARAKLAKASDVTDQRDNQNLTRQEE